MWKDFFKVMATAGVPVWARFNVDQLLPDGKHCKGNMTEVMAKQLAFAPRVNRPAESGFAMLKRMKSVLGQSATHTTTSAMVMAKFNQPLSNLVEARTAPGSLLRQMLYKWAIWFSATEFARDKEREVKLMNDKTEEEEAHRKVALEKEVEAAKVWAGLRLRTDEMVKNKRMLQEAFKTVTHKAQGKSKTATRLEQMQFLRLQKQFLLLVGVSKKEMPVQSSVDETGKRKDLDVSVFCDLLGNVFDRLAANELELNPVPLLSKRFEGLITFRRGTATPQMKAFKEQEEKRLEQVDKAVKEQMEQDAKQLDQAKKKAPVRKSAKVATSQAKAWDDVGQTVWVIEEDEEGIAYVPEVWSGKVKLHEVVNGVEGIHINFKGQGGAFFLSFGTHLSHYVGGKGSPYHQPPF